MNLGFHDFSLDSHKTNLSFGQVPPGALPGQVIQIAAPVAPVVVGAPMGAWEPRKFPETLEMLKLQRVFEKKTQRYFLPTSLDMLDTYVYIYMKMIICCMHIVLLQFVRRNILWLLQNRHQKKWMLVLDGGIRPLHCWQNILIPQCNMYM